MNQEPREQAAAHNASEVRFDAEALLADITGHHDDDDPWGAEDPDEYAVPHTVTRADDEEERKRRRGRGPMALRGSGTRGRKQRGAAGTGPMGAAGGAPGATVGGVGGPVGAPGATGVPGGQGGMVPQPMTMGAAGGSAGATSMMPGSMVPGSMMSGSMAAGRTLGSGASFTGVGAGAGAGAGAGQGGLVVGSVPPGGGMIAAGASGVDADQLREALRRSGMEHMVTVDADGRIIVDPLVDTDGDGIPDTPASKAGGGGSGSGSGLPGYAPPGVPIGSPPGSGQPAPLPGVQPAPIYGVQPAPVPGVQPAPVPGVQPAPVYGMQPTNPQYPAPAPVNNPGPIAAGSGTDGRATGTGDSTYGSEGGAAEARSSSVSFKQPSYQPSGSAGGTDFSVSTGELRQAASTWENVAGKSSRLATDMMSSPDPVAMFGVMDKVVTPYESAVDNSIDAAAGSGNQSAQEAIKLVTAAGNYDETEATNMAEGERAGQ